MQASLLCQLDIDRSQAGDPAGCEQTSLSCYLCCQCVQCLIWRRGGEKLVLDLRDLQSNCALICVKLINKLQGQRGQLGVHALYTHPLPAPNPSFACSYNFMFPVFQHRLPLRHSQMFTAAHSTVSLSLIKGAF